MAKVKMLVGMGSLRGSINVGDIYECSEAEAGRLIAAGFAEALQPKPQQSLDIPEAATLRTPETAAIPAARGRGRRG